MATFKAEVYAHQKRADGTYNIKIRVIHNKKKKYIATTYYVTKDDLTRTTLKLKNQKYIDATDAIIKKYRQSCDKLGERLKYMTIEQVVDIITNDIGERFDLDIVDYANKYIMQLKHIGRTGTARVYATAISSLKKFAGRDTISIHEINVKFLNRWITWIGEQPSYTKKERGVRAQSLYIAQLRAIHNRAKKEFNDEDAGIIRIPYSPFNKVDLPTQILPRKRAISIDLLRKFAELPYTHTNHRPGNNLFNLAKDVFLLSFYLIGMNAVDLYNCKGECYKNGRITYQRTKTKTRRIDNAEISIRVEPEILPLIEKYKDNTGERVFRFYQMYVSTSWSRALNMGLKLIGKELGIDGLEFYAARHTWATIAINDVGIDKYTVHAALNHVDEKMKITDTYIKKSWKPLDEANRKVIDFCNFGVLNVDER